MYEHKGFPLAGAHASYGPSITASYRRSVWYIDRILKGTKAGRLPIRANAQFELVINLRTAKALGLTAPQTLLGSAEEVTINAQHFR